MTLPGTVQDREFQKFLETASGDTAVRIAELPITFGSADNLSEVLNDMFEVENSNGFSTLGFYISPPTGGEITFETTYDGINWEATSLRGVTSDIVTSVITTTGNFIGSISTNRSFRFRTSIGGSAPGTVQGTIQRNTAVIENIEFMAAPHKVGYDTVRKHSAFTTAQTDTVLWTPPSGKRIVLTDMFVFAYGNTDGRLTVFMETNATGNLLFNTEVKVATMNPFSFAHQFKLGIVGGVDEEIKFTSSAAVDVDIMLQGYEV